MSGSRGASTRRAVMAALVLAAAPDAARAQEGACPVGQACAPPPPVAAPAAPAAEWRAGVEYGYVHLESGGTSLDPWHAVTAELARRGGGLTVVGRANWARRFGESGVQVEADAYPRIAPGWYAYLNAGYSRAEIFPQLRLGGEVYASPGAGTEVSLGARHLRFDEGVTLYTGSAGIYRGNYYVSVRPFVTPRDEGTSVSGLLLARRYFSSADSYATLTLGAGTAPTEAPLEFELQRSNTRRVGLYGKTPLRSGVGVRWSAGYEHEALTRAQDRRRFSLGLGLDARL